MTTPTVISKHELLERKANIVRSRLLRTIDTLDRRRHEITDIGADAKAVVKRAALPVGVGIGALVAIASGISYALHRRAERMRRRSLRYWMFRAFAPPPPPRPNVLLEALRKSAIAIIVAVATEVAKRQAAQLAGAAVEPAPHV